MVTTETYEIAYVTKKDLELIKRFYINWNDCEFGAPTIDPKRPFGNSDVVKDYEKITGTPYSELEYRHLQTCLEILCNNLSIEEGTYERKQYSNKWVKR